MYKIIITLPNTLSFFFLKVRKAWVYSIYLFLCLTARPLVHPTV